ncbi:hypothetical protein DUI87_03791 [Hirundo rustica rustica]|uniref:ribonuclease H n=1 Tax=Hirundo rustica rustica TaxID=333673 RepID=A0A3M0L273_HIRRU|nr:hypothetical protein DUI87_03791 [Hirundo rustica rustica]
MVEGRWVDPLDQATNIPVKALQVVRSHAVTAFFGMAPEGPVVPYYKIVQVSKEPFTKFVEWLTRAIEVQVQDVVVREGILREMVFANANVLCRNAILSLSLDPAPTILDMLRVCQMKVPFMQGIVTTSKQEPYKLQLTEAVDLKNAEWIFISVNMKEQGTWPLQGEEFIIIGDSVGQAVIHHYMDDVLVCAPSDNVLTHALDLTINALIAAGFELQEEKVQRMPPWKYLGLEISKRTIVPQKLAIKTKGSYPRSGKGSGESTGCNVLKADSPIRPRAAFQIYCNGKLPYLHGMIFQWKDIPKKDRDGNDPLSIIEWVFLSHHRSKRMTRPQELVAELIRKARFRIRELAGCDFACIHTPIGLRSGQITRAMLEHLLQENEALQFALDSFAGQFQSIGQPTKFLIRMSNLYYL